MHQRQDLVGLQHRLLRLAESVDRVMVSAQHVLRAQDLAEGNDVIANRKAVEQLRVDLEAEAHQLFAQQPRLIGEELRSVTAALVLAGELQRIGDYARDIVTEVACATEPGPLSMPGELGQMAHRAREILQGSIRAIITRDAAAVGRIRAADARVDELYQQIRQSLLAMLGANAKQSEWIVDLLWIAYRLERIADCGVQIAERAVFIATGVWPAPEIRDIAIAPPHPRAHDWPMREPR